MLAGFRHDRGGAVVVPGLPQHRKSDEAPQMHEVFEWYTRQHDDHERKPPSSTDFEKTIDTVDADIVAKLKIKDLVKFAPAWAEGPLRFVLNGSEGGKPPPMNSDEERKRIQARRTRPQGVIRGLEAQAVQYLAKSCGIFQQIEEFKNYEFQARAGLFFIPKNNGKLRVIIDARDGNAFMSAGEYQFNLFSLESLINVISGLSASEQWYAINVDLRHYFHQIPFPPQLRKYFVLETEVWEKRANGKAEKVTRWFIAMSTPMGWVLAPLVAQCATLSLLLARETYKDGPMPADVARSLDLDPDYLQKLQHMPPWIPLKSGGGIFVILDNVLVVTPRRDVADAWLRRIKEKFQTFDATAKLEPGEVLHVITLRRGADAKFDFLGITWKHAARQVKLDDDAAPHDSLVTAGRPWAGTRRQLASIMGKLLWYHRVHQLIPRAGAKMCAFRELYQSTTPSPETGNWDETITLTLAQTAVLREHWHDRAARDFVPSKALPALTAPAFAAVDASKIGVGVVLVDGNAHEAYVEHPRWPQDWTIAVAELWAILRGVQLLKAKDSTCTLFVVATDSQNAKSWAQRQYANNSAANRLLDELSLELGDRRLYLVYVRSENNAADEPSRVKEGTVFDGRIDGARLDATRKLLVSAAVEATGMWSREGGRVGGRPHVGGEM